MPDIFISYKKEEHAVASLLATRLTEAGYEVWWDDALLAGERFEDEITAVLDRSGVVVVLWSKQSIQSDWVKAEAETARQQKKALPVIIDDMPASKMPLLYRGMHAARLAGWEGEPEHSGYIELIGSIRERLGRATGPQLSESQAEAKLEQSVDKAKAIVASATAAPTAPPVARPPSAAPPPSDPSPTPPARPSPLRWIIGAVVALVVVGGAGAFAYLQLAGLSPEDRAKIDRCAAWAMSGRVDPNTTVPPLDTTTPDDCARAAERVPDNGDHLGMLALVRIAQGSPQSSEAVALANRAIDRGGAIGHYAMGVMYDRGINFTADSARAASAFKAAADMGLARAQGRLCLMGIDASMVLPIAMTREEILPYCNKAAAANDSFGLLATGYAFESGIDGRIINPAAAADYYQRAADLGDDDARVRLGILYNRGEGVPFDMTKALPLYQQAADNGNPGGMRSLAINLELGDGIPVDVNLAGRLYEQASIRWDIPALLISGYGIAPPAVLTSRQRRDAELIASTTGIVTGQRIRGNMMTYGNLRNRDPAVAEQELKACADVGNAICQAQLGYFYQSGFNGPANPSAALQLYEASAAQGNLYGQYYLAWANEIGTGTAVNMDKAIQYYRLAAEQGHLTAINRLKQLGQALQ